ncbi:MAG: hypothetical protein IEMM0002_0205 [bacterium]|nr:MAG: hypothetical protein IEMM0002_0205 [bacterium]
MSLLYCVEKNRRYSPIFKGALANHASMGLIALNRLGADGATLKEFFERSESSLNHIAEDSLEITKETYGQYKGEIHAFPAYLEFFTNLAGSSRSVDEIIKEYLPELMPGLAGGAFHPLIRLSYAIEQGDEEEIVFSLAYFYAAYGDLGQLPDVGNAAFEPDRFLKKIREQNDMRLEPSRGLIYAQMKKAGKLAGFNSLIGGFQPDESCLPGIAKAAVAIYLAAGNIITLHGVTGVHAFRIVIPYLQDLQTPILALWQAVCAVYIAVSAPEPAVPSREPAVPSRSKNVPDWAAIKTISLKSTDVHTIKFVYSCVKEERCYNNRDYRVAAMNKISSSR